MHAVLDGEQISDERVAAGFVERRKRDLVGPYETRNTSSMCSPRMTRSSRSETASADEPDWRAGSRCGDRARQRVERAARGCLRDVGMTRYRVDQIGLVHRTPP